MQRGILKTITASLRNGSRGRSGNIRTQIKRSLAICTILKVANAVIKLLIRIYGTTKT